VACAHVARTQVRACAFRQRVVARARLRPVQLRIQSGERTGREVAGGQWHVLCVVCVCVGNVCKYGSTPAYVQAWCVRCHIPGGSAVSRKARSVSVWRVVVQAGYGGVVQRASPARRFQNVPREECLVDRTVLSGNCPCPSGDARRLRRHGGRARVGVHTRLKPKLSITIRGSGATA